MNICSDLQTLIFIVSSAFRKEPWWNSEFTASEIRYRDDSMKDAHIAVCVKGVGWTHDDFVPLLVAQTMIGSWDRSLGILIYLGLIFYRF